IWESTKAVRTMVDRPAKSGGRRRLLAVAASAALMLVLGGAYVFVPPAFSAAPNALTTTELNDGVAPSLPPAALTGHYVAQDIAAQQAKAVLGAKFVGSKACQSCHQDIY